MNDRHVDINLLVTLEALLVEQNVTRAAHRLHLSQPAVSARLRRLRGVFGDPLLVPARRGMIPTARALELLDPLRHALDQVRATISEHTSFDPARAHLTVVIACTDYIQVAVGQPLILWLRQHAPGVRVALCNLDLPRLGPRMARGEVDLALMTPDASLPGLRTRHLFDERYVLIGRRGHPKLRKRITVAQFAKLEHVIVSLRGADFATPVDDALAAHGYRRNVVLSASSFLFLPHIVAQSDLVALVPERLVSDRASELQIAECPFPVEGFEVGMVWHERNHGHGGQRWIREALRTLVAQ